MNHADTKSTNSGYQQELKRTLTFKSLLIFGIAYMALTTVMTYMGIVAQMTHGMVALVFCIATAAMLFTSFSYAKMVRAYPVAGSAYAYTSNSINPHAGFMTGWVMLLDYALLAILSFVLLGLYMNVLFPSVPAWVFVIAGVVLLTIVQYVGVDIMAKVNSVLVIIAAIFMIAFFFMMLRFIVEGSGVVSLFDIKGLVNTSELSQIGLPAIFSAASILVLCFLGCDAVTTLAEEAMEPKKNIGRAIIVITLGMGLYFIIYSYVMQLSWPTGWMEFKNPDTAAEELVGHVGGSALAYVFSAIYALTCISCSLAAQTSATRVLYSMGRDGVLPKKFFGYVHPKYKTPTKNILLTSVLAVILGCTIDLMSISSIINFGALIGFTMVNICVIVYYFGKEKSRHGFVNFFSYLVSPLIGAGICLSIWVNLDQVALILGGIWTAIGFIYLAITTKGFKKAPKTMSFDEDMKIE